VNRVLKGLTKIFEKHFAKDAQTNSKRLFKCIKAVTHLENLASWQGY